jgi:hypothetical protein
LIVIGNGESRQGINISSLTGTKIGCNAVHRDLHVDHLVCVDRGPIQEALAANLTSTTLWTRDNLPETPQGSQRVDQPRHWGSGPYAVLLATTMSEEIHMVGFDLWSNDRLVNNVYKGTNNYSDAGSHAVDPRYWVYQISRIFLANTDKYFIVYNKPNWTLPQSWCLANVIFKTLDKLGNKT